MLQQKLIKYQILIKNQFKYINKKDLFYITMD